MTAPSWTYLVEGIYNANGQRSYSATPRTFQQAISADVADTVKGVLVGVVRTGTGTAAAIEGVQVAGKTGTAETGREHDDSWFVGMAPADDPQVVVAIVLEEDEIEGDGAAKAQNVLKTALQTAGVL